MTFSTIFTDKKKKLRGSINTPENPAKVFESRASRLPYIEAEWTSEKLANERIAGVLTIDTNRKNFFVATYCAMVDREKFMTLLRDTRGARDGRQVPRQVTSSGCNQFKTKLQTHTITIRVTKKEYATIRDIKRCRLERQKMSVAEFGSLREAGEFFASPSVKGTLPELVRHWCEYMNTDDRLSRSNAFYAQRRFRVLRMDSYSAEQRMWAYIQDKIYAQLNAAGCRLVNPRLAKRGRSDDGITPNRLLIAFGDGSFSHNSSGHIAMPSGHAFFEHLQQQGEHIGYIDEMNTSKCCSYCTSEMEQATITKKLPIPRTSRRRLAGMQLALDAKKVGVGTAGDAIEMDGTHHRSYENNSRSHAPGKACRYPTAYDPDDQCTTPPASPADRRVEPAAPSVGLLWLWGLRACSSEQCGNRIWCRDVNACTNMMRRYFTYLATGAPPAYLSRKPTITVMNVIQAGNN